MDIEKIDKQLEQYQESIAQFTEAIEDLKRQREETLPAKDNAFQEVDSIPPLALDPMDPDLQACLQYSVNDLGFKLHTPEGIMLQHLIRLVRRAKESSSSREEPRPQQLLFEHNNRPR